jgi:predicted O-linked N-acetylglucosamine transferase (SPINDLY family)
VTFVGHKPRKAYLGLYHHIEIDLDTFPYNGDTTNLDSLWIGVPVITRAGQTVVGHAGLAQLTHFGLHELIGDSPEEFVRIAFGLAGDLPRLGELRTTLRRRMELSLLMDSEGVAQGIEALTATCGNAGVRAARSGEPVWLR